MEVNEEIQMIRDALDALDCTCGDEADSSYFGKDLDLAIETLVQENFWELAGKPAVETSEDAPRGRKNNSLT